MWNGRRLREKIDLLFGPAAGALSSFAAAQQPASISGTVTDQTGAVITGATITLTNSGKLKLTATSDAQGNFKFSDLQPGTYDVTVTASGFKQFHTENLTVDSRTGTSA